MAKNLYAPAAKEVGKNRKAKLRNSIIFGLALTASAALTGCIRYIDDGYYPNGYYQPEYSAPFYYQTQLQTEYFYDYRRGVIVEEVISCANGYCEVIGLNKYPSRNPRGYSGYVFLPHVRGGIYVNVYDWEHRDHWHKMWGDDHRRHHDDDRRRREERIEHPKDRRVEPRPPQPQPKPQPMPSPPPMQPQPKPQPMPSPLPPQPQPKPQPMRSPPPMQPQPKPHTKHPVPIPSVPPQNISPGTAPQHQSGAGQQHNQHRPDRPPKSGAGQQHNQHRPDRPPTQKKGPNPQDRAPK